LRKAQTLARLGIIGQSFRIKQTAQIVSFLFIMPTPMGNFAGIFAFITVTLATNGSHLAVSTNPARNYFLQHFFNFLLSFLIVSMSLA
jgi:hypothetical protein